MRRAVFIAFLSMCATPWLSHAKSVDTETITISPAPDAQRSPGLEVDELSLGDTQKSPTTQQSTDLPQVYYDLSYLPKPVARMHSQLREAAINGDLSRLKMVLESNELLPTLSFGEIDDPIDFIKQSSGDGEGFEILAILADVLDAGFLHVDVDSPQEMYIWPYFARYPLHSLTPDQKVEMFRIITAGDFAEMEDFGAWTFYRLGIGPDGTMHFFVAGD